MLETVFILLQICQVIPVGVRALNREDLSNAVAIVQSVLVVDALTKKMAIIVLSVLKMKFAFFL